MYIYSKKLLINASVYAYGILKDNDTWKFYETYVVLRYERTFGSLFSFPVSTFSSWNIQKVISFFTLKLIKILIGYQGHTRRRMCVYLSGRVQNLDRN